MESVDSSPNYMRPRSRFDPKQENSPGGSDHDEMMSVSSSSCGSAVNKPNARKFSNNGIKYRTVRSFRRRPNPRLIISLPISDEESSEASPHYLRGTTSSEGKKSRSQATHRLSESIFDGSDMNSSHSSQTKVALPRTSSLRNVRILIKRASFKPKRSSLKYSKVSEDVHVDRATYSSTIKDSKFPVPVELPRESEKTSALRVCRYHHCSLHGGCHGGHDPAPPPKRFLYKRKQSMRKQKSVVPKTETRRGVRVSSDKKKNLHKSQVVSEVESSNQERFNDSIAVSGVENEIGVDSDEGKYPNKETEQFGDGYEDVQESYLVELAFGETSFPERSYQDSLDIMRKYTPEELDLQKADKNGFCSTCSCHNREKVTTTPKRVEADDLSPREATASSLEGQNNKEIPINGSSVVSGISSLIPFEKLKELDDTYVVDIAVSCADEAAGKDGSDTSIVFDEISEKRSACSSASSSSQTSTDTNSDEDAESTSESTESSPAEDPKADEVAREDSETNTPTHSGSTLHFSKPRHISMWHMIHQHMSSSVSAESENKLVQGGDGESSLQGVDSKDSMPASRDQSETNIGRVTDDTETQEIELRKLFAVKLVREAIEKILLPAVQDPASDDQSVTSESTPRPELVENNQTQACNDAESDADRANVDVSPTPKIESVVAGEASAGEMRESEKQVARKTEKKTAPKHWSNLKKWILLQRFIKELEKVRRFNPKKPQLLPLNPDPEAEKVNLRPQTVDERKSAEEWMLDHALRQAVSQLAPTQKKKVALLVKAFETVVPLQEESQVQSRIPRLKSNVVSIFKAANENGEPISKARSLNIDGNGTLVPVENTLSRDPNPEVVKVGSSVEDVNLDGNGTLVPVENTLSRDPNPDVVKVGNLVEDEAETEAKETKKNHIKMWHMIYQHVVSNIAEKVGDQFLEGDEGDEAEDNRTKFDALKLVKEAMEEILVPEVQDESSDTQSVSSDSIQEQDESYEIGGKNTPKDEDSKAESKPELPKAGNWRKLKKLMLLKRSIKALEKARKVGQQTQKVLLPQTSDLEAEKVDLRQQMMDERKKAEQWMLDYAVQHIVTTLTPARKRRVSMLVEAFEAVVPLPEV